MLQLYYTITKTASKNAVGKRNSHKIKDDDDIIRIEGGMPAIVSLELYERVNTIIQRRKRVRGMYNGKELYLLQGLIKCGECGFTFEGNRRVKKDKPVYVTYRCGARHRKLSCDNKEIRKEYIEEYVLIEMEKRLLNDDAIKVLSEKMNGYLKEKFQKDKTEAKEIINNLHEIDAKIRNIVEAISGGFYQEEFKTEMERLKAEKMTLETQLDEMKDLHETPELTEDQIRLLFSQFRKFVLERNLPQCKQIVQDYVESVIIYKDHVEVTFNVDFLFGKNHEVQIQSTINKKKLIGEQKQAMDKRKKKNKVKNIKGPVGAERLSSKERNKDNTEFQHIAR